MNPPVPLDGSAEAPPLQFAARGGKRRRKRFPAAVFAAALLTGFGGPLTSTVRAGYTVEDVPYPAEIRGGLSAVTFTPSGALVIATRLGEVWIRDERPTPGWRG